MEPTDFPESNCVMKPPPGMENCEPLPIHRDAGAMRSCWVVSDEDIERITRTRRVWVQIFGGMHPPVWVGSEGFESERREVAERKIDIGLALGKDLAIDAVNAVRSACPLDPGDHDALDSGCLCDSLWKIIRSQINTRKALIDAQEDNHAHPGIASVLLILVQIMASDFLPGDKDR